MTLKYKRILLKLSGEALMGKAEYGIESETLIDFCKQIVEVVKMGVKVGVVVGGGNIFRGVKGQAQGIDRAQGDYMGMLATVINGMALQDALVRLGQDVRLQSAIEMSKICEPYIRRRALRHLEKGRVVVFAGGTGNPFFTTDTAASLRAIEMGAEIVLKGTNVDGVYSADPRKDANAVKYDTVSFDEVIVNNLNVMDMTAFALCKENKLPIVVFNIHEPDNLLRIVSGERIGTIVS